MNQMPDGVGHSAPAQPPAGFDWDLWCGPGPMRPFNPILVSGAYNHCSWMDYSGGWTPGMAPHIIDLPIWALDLGFPLRTSSSGGRYFLKDDGDAYDNHEVLWQYPNFTLTWMSSLTNSYGFDLHGKPAPERRLGMYFHGANGTMYANYDHFKIVPEGNKMDGVAAAAQVYPAFTGPRARMARLHQIAPAAELQRVLPYPGGCALGAQLAVVEAGTVNPL